ncbi:acetylgalactosaminyl-O-glycosyl-glycoprotein beta-1,3-N-acetylglucosaminyltransferase-like [Daphnia carinata]|uniref:acetylgalactosaminyl-O-glycosyl-glycoprotein beta-1,3-N-acetylglucosaminyltransferase-like n=1 Tax=Daphnia carinata TaxID=120202 RepID=UPI00257BA03C|nr:acetylgalactosaminyl-O-glycosyl-glycoprotein beta-1,3-N-acetylglucosaminyltransferase-like [Daphnia carinata]
MKYPFTHSEFLRRFNKKSVFVKLFVLTVIAVCIFIIRFNPSRFPINVPVRQLTNKPKVAIVNNSAVVGHVHNTRRRVLGYTGYTIQRLGLKPIPLTSSLQSNNVEPVVNDVLSFIYPIDISAQQKFKCREWANRSIELVPNVKRTLLIIVVSAAEHSAKRDLIRKTWAGPSLRKEEEIQLIFLVGSTLNEDKVIKNRLENENEKYEDVVQVNVIDTYANLTLKSVALLHWAYSHCPAAQLVLKCDDDTYLNFHVLSKLINKQQLKPMNRLYGLGIMEDSPQRDPNNKYYISRHVWPWSKYPAFLSGGGYLLGRDTIQPLLAAVQTTPLFPLEDVYLTGICARKARIKSLSSRRIYERFIPKKLDACFVRSTAMWQTQSKVQFLQSHDIVSLVYRRNLTCRIACKYLGIC